MKGLLPNHTHATNTHFTELAMGRPNDVVTSCQNRNIKIMFIYGVRTTFHRLTWQSYSGRIIQVIISAKALPISLC